MLPRVPFEIVAVHDARCRSEAQDEGFDTLQGLVPNKCKTKQAPVKMTQIFETHFLIHRRAFHSAFNCVEVEIGRPQYLPKHPPRSCPDKRSSGSDRPRFASKQDTGGFVKTTDRQNQLLRRNGGTIMEDS
ncbi:hypothetical protein GJ744_006627 [Endocarpon pusillum]|uniref:Uncharacterized protein n=1 Tax=Endocarpon pusillum TaxID=364733 RepID=A0A8H7ARG5_9EURO|nr:hypothetical protein GJ744_006627 [Endocarpon pusillum]